MKVITYICDAKDCGQPALNRLNDYDYCDRHYEQRLIMLANL